MVANQNWKVVFGISIFILLLIYLLDTYISNTQEQLYKRLENSMVQDMSYIAQNFDKEFKKNVVLKDDESLFEHLKSKSKLRQDIEHNLHYLVTSKIKYLYIIYQDEKERFRFLADGSNEDKARFNQKLDVDNTKYKEVYTLKEELAITQKSLDALAITFLYPLIYKENVEALLVFDFSSNTESELHKIISPLKTMFMLMYILVAVFLVVTLIQTLLYYQARKRSYIDELTGVYNRQYLRYFLDSHDIEEYKILMLDFDYFKKINDNYGHSIGDKVLVFGTQLIQCELSKEDKLFRYGGEEFLVLLHKQSDAITAAERIRKKIDEEYFIDENISINISLSIGVNPFPSHARNTSKAINIADSMLYKAKLQGRNRVVSYTLGMQIDIDEKHSSSHNIHGVVEALAEDRVICCFHKIIDQKNQAYKYEVLVRYRDKDGEMIYPNHFLSDIMHTKVYTDLTKKVIDISIDMIQSQNIQMSINLNVNDLLNSDIVEYIIYKVNEASIGHDYLTIEILENEEIHNIKEIQGVVTKLHSYGLKFALDDFGSGYANYSYLIELEIDYIKIDGYLVENVLKSEKSMSIVKSIIDLAHEMNVKTIVEFVSSKEIHDAMLSLGTDYLQGFYISKPEQEI